MVQDRMPLLNDVILDAFECEYWSGRDFESILCKIFKLWL